jgi:glycosyltransferase involved in cell wall biosynthesis
VVIATPTGGTPEIVTDGENGLLFKPNDPKDLAQKIVQLINDPKLRGKLSEAGMKTVLEKFTMSKMMDEVESYLQDVAGVSIIDESVNQHHYSHA